MLATRGLGLPAAGTIAAFGLGLVATTLTPPSPRPASGGVWFDPPTPRRNDDDEVLILLSL